MTDHPIASLEIPVKVQEVIARLRLTMKDHLLCSGDGCMRHQMCIRPDTCPETAPAKDAIELIESLTRDLATVRAERDELAARCARQALTIHQRQESWAEMNASLVRLRSEVEQANDILARIANIAWASFEHKGCREIYTMLRDEAGVTAGGR